MYNIRLFQRVPDGSITKRVASKHIEIYEKESGIVLLVVYDDYTSKNGVEYRIHDKSDEGYNSVIVELNGDLVYKYVV